MAIGDTSTKNKRVNLESAKFTENGLYVPNTGVTGFGKVTVAVPPDAMKKPLYITPTGSDKLNDNTWDEYSGPYEDIYSEVIGYKLQNNQVFNFSGVFLGTADSDGVIKDNDNVTIGKVSEYHCIYDLSSDIIGYADSKNYAFDFEDNKIGTVQATGEVLNDEGTQIGTKSVSEFVAYSTKESNYVGVRDVKVRRVGSWIDSNISADNIRKGHKILGVAGSVVELLPQEKTVHPSSHEIEVTPDSTHNGLTKVTVEAMNLQEKRNVTARAYNVEVHTSAGYDAMSLVQINAVTADVDSNIKPENIKKNVTVLGVKGTYDNYVAPVVQATSIAPTTNEQVITPPKGVDGFNKVTVSAVTSSIDANIKPENIKRDVEILGITGTYKIENLQNKAVDPQQYIQNVTFDSALGYEGLGTVTVNAVTSSVDSNIAASNIKKDVTILGVTGEYDPQPNIQPTVTVNPTTLAQSVTPSEGYDGLGQVDINAVTAAIDPNILAENIKKNISILGVTGTYEDVPNFQESKTVEPSASGDIIVTADTTYDALLKVIVKAVTASIDPNIVPKNIRKNISILGVLGTMEEGGEQKWFDFSGVQNFSTLNQDAYSEGGMEKVRIDAVNNNYNLSQFINETFPSIGNINGVMFTQVYGYDDEEITDDLVKECYINFVGGNLYQEYSELTLIPDQLRYFYPYENEDGIPGLTFGLEDDGQERTMNLYVLTDSSKVKKPVPVLVNGSMTADYVVDDYDGFRFVKEITIPAHDVYIGKAETNSVTHHVLRDEDAVRGKYNSNEDFPQNITISAYDRDKTVADLQVPVFNDYSLQNSTALVFDKTTLIASQFKANERGILTTPEDLVKQDDCYYYFKFSPKAYAGNNSYYTFVICNGLMALGLYRSGTNNYWYPAWYSTWSSESSGTWATNTSSTYRMTNNNVYYYRVYVNGNSTQISWSTDGTTWKDLATITSEFINPTNTNPLYIYSEKGPNQTLYTDGIYIIKENMKLYTPYVTNYIKQTSHEIVPLSETNLLVNRTDDRVDYKFYGDEEIVYDSYDPETKEINFGRGGYLYCPRGFNATNKVWEVRLHFKLHPYINSNNRHLITWEGGSDRNVIWISTNQQLYVRFRYDSGNNAVNGRISTYKLVNETEYFLKAGWDGYNYYTICATDHDFNNRVIEWSGANATTNYCATEGFLLCNWTKTHVDGSNLSLYLDDFTSIRVNNETVWAPVTKEIEGSLVNYNHNGETDTLNMYLARKNTPEITNAAVYGSPIVTNEGVATNFNGGNFIILPKLFNTSDNFETVFKFKITDSEISYTHLFDCGEYNFRIQINSDKTIHVNTGNGAGKWGAGVTSSFTLEQDVIYWIKVVKINAAYTITYSTDGESWTTVGTLTYASNAKNRVVRIGAWRNYGNPALKLYLKDSYIKVNDELWWQGDATHATQKSTNTYFYNTPLLSDNFTVIDTFNKQYICSRNKFKPESNTWKIQGLFKFYSLGGCLFSTGYEGSDTNYGLKVDLNTNGTLSMKLSSAGTHWDIADITSTEVLAVNKEYLIELAFDGTKYQLSATPQDTEGATSVVYATAESTTTIHDTDNFIVFGTDGYTVSAATNINGKIDLKKCSIAINNVVVWTPAFRTSYEYEWILSKDDNWTYEGLTNLGKKGEITVPEHTAYSWNQPQFVWNGTKKFVFNLNDENSVLYISTSKTVS